MARRVLMLLKGKLRATVVGATSKLIELLTSDTRIYAYVASITSVITKLADNSESYLENRNMTKLAQRICIANFVLIFHGS